jgi:dTDP-4-dehydrorhamnose 3,5-epimerase-like enzyme
MSIAPETTVKDASFMDFQLINVLDAEIKVYQNFEIKRIFTVTVEQSMVRGNHAHRKCTQLFLVKYGEVLFEIYDGDNFVQYNLTASNSVLQVPPGLWTVQRYLRRSEIIVLCDQVYDEKDYIRDWVIFESYKNLKS